MRKGPQLTQVEISPILQTCRSCQSRGRKPPTSPSSKFARRIPCAGTPPLRDIVYTPSWLDDCVSSTIVRIPLLVGRYTCACFYELEWLPSRTQTRQRKRPFSYLKRRRRNNYHCCLSVSSASPHFHILFTRPLLSPLPSLSSAHRVSPFL